MCQDNYKTCKNYNKNEQKESRCQTDSTIGYCIIENDNGKVLMVNKE